METVFLFFGLIIFVCYVLYEPYPKFRSVHTEKPQDRETTKEHYTESLTMIARVIYGARRDEELTTAVRMIDSFERNYCNGERRHEFEAMVKEMRQAVGEKTIELSLVFG